jgi:hypothetical protein
LITPTSRRIDPEKASISVTPVHGDNQKIRLLMEEIISMERYSENGVYTSIRCTSKRRYLVCENIAEITRQLETQLQCVS